MSGQVAGGTGRKKPVLQRLNVKEFKPAMIKAVFHNMNLEAVGKNLDSLVKIEYPVSWAVKADQFATDEDEAGFVKSVLFPMTAQQGERLPVSAFYAGWELPGGHLPIWKKGGWLSGPSKGQKKNIKEIQRCRM